MKAKRSGRYKGWASVAWTEALQRPTEIPLAKPAYRLPTRIATATKWLPMSRALKELSKTLLDVGKGSLVPPGRPGKRSLSWREVVGVVLSVLCVRIGWTVGGGSMALFVHPPVYPRSVQSYQANRATAVLCLARGQARYGLEFLVVFAGVFFVCLSVRARGNPQTHKPCI